MLWCAVAVLPAVAASGYEAGFDHGVASGDPMSDSIVLWTRVTPRLPRKCVSDLHGQPPTCAVTEQTESIGVEYTVAEDRRLTRVVKTGAAQASADSDWTVKVIPSGLPHSRKLYYAFTAGPARSRVGEFKLPPPAGQQLHSLQYASFSCSNWGWGLFNAYDAAVRLDLDFWLHLGDWYYEYGENVFPSAEEAVRRGLDPKHEAVTLDDYRRRHALYRTDPSLQALSAASPVIATWDDHEIANNPWKDGAENHQPDGPRRPEGDWEVRKRAAVQAYHEWMPTREGPEPARAFDFGDLARMSVLETRLHGRTSGEIEMSGNPNGTVLERIMAVVNGKRPEALDAAQRAQLSQLREETENVRADPNSWMMGEDQAEWLRTTGVSTTPRWNLVAQQTVVADCYTPDVVGAARDSGNEEWVSLVENLTVPGATVTDRNPLSYNALSYGRPITISDSTARFMAASFAAADVRIPTYFDSWCGYAAARERLLDAVSQAGERVVIYSGDSHSSWAVMHRRSNGSAVAAEFGVTAVTSPGPEHGWLANYLPHTLVERGVQKANNRSSRASRYDGGQVHYSGIGDRGFLRVRLTHSRHVAEFMAVSTVADPDYTLSCLRAYEYTGVDDESDIRQTSCSPLIEPGTQLWPVIEPPHPPVKEAGDGDKCPSGSTRTGTIVAALMFTVAVHVAIQAVVAYRRRKRYAPAEQEQELEPEPGSAEGAGDGHVSI